MFKIESDWAYAMNLKQMAAKKGHKLNPNRLRVHSLKRFKKAAVSAKQL